jgi:non-ribosomal peptide synthase protein (TIGR01720 family)
MKQGVAELNASLNLSKGPLVAVDLFDLGAKKTCRLQIAIHHLVMDAISCHILLEDLDTAYRQLSQGEAIQLPPKTTAVKQWAQQLTAYAQSDALRVEAAYWLSLSWFQGSRLPVDYPGGVNTAASGRHLSICLSNEETRALLQEVPKAYNTQITDALLTALAQTLLRWTGARSHIVTLESHGREQIIEGVDLSRTVGWFTATFPTCLDLAETSGPGDALKAIKEQIRRIPNRGIGYGLLRYLAADKEIANQLRALPQPQVGFAYLGQLDQVLPNASPFGLKSIELSHGVGGGHRSHLLDISALVIDGRLQIDWAYSELIHRESTIKDLAHEFMEALRALITHRDSGESVDRTPSDFTGATLNQEDLDKIVASY